MKIYISGLYSGTNPQPGGSWFADCHAGAYDRSMSYAFGQG
jgi:hypothetical protein